MKITTKKDALSFSKPEGTQVSYYLFPEYEVHINEQAPNSTQMWHHHEKIWETIYIIEGELSAIWKEDGETRNQIVKAGDLLETEHTPHTFSNISDTVVKFLVIKQVLNGVDKKELFKTDKVLD